MVGASFHHSYASDLACGVVYPDAFDDMVWVSAEVSWVCSLGHSALCSACEALGVDVKMLSRVYWCWVWVCVTEVLAIIFR